MYQFCNMQIRGIVKESPHPDQEILIVEFQEDKKKKHF